MSLFSSNNQDIFRTQADNRFNSFSEPMNSVNQSNNNGQWGINPTYLTPSFTSPFRPQYQTQNDGSAFQASNPGFFHSANQLFNPLASGGSNYGGNYWAQQAPFYTSLANRPGDTLASFAQNWVVPASMSWAAFKLTENGMGALGRGVGSGVGRGLFGGLGTSAAGTAGRIGGVVGGFVGKFGGPMAIAQAGVRATDNLMFDPYIAQRQMGRSLRENFSGVNFGESGAGDPFTGGGLSRRMAQGIARNMSKAASRDMTFDQKETSLLTDYASRSGLMDNVNASQLSSRFESILKQVKVVMSIANTSDFKESIEMLSKLQMSGISSTQSSGVMGRLSAMAAAGGQSFNKLFNTVGTQGQYMFGASGLTPYLGHTTSFGASGALSALNRVGGISAAGLARMGGVEGGTQSATAATIASYTTPYSNMIAQNAYFGGGSMGSVVGNLSKFGGHIAGNPLENIGNHNMMGSALASAHIRDRGLAGEQDQVHEIAKMIPGGVGPDGKVSAGVAYMIMTQQMGHTNEMAISKLKQLSAYANPSAVKTMLAGNTRSSMEAMMSYNSQEGLNRGWATKPINAVKKAWLGMQGGMAESVGNALFDTGGVSDDIGSWVTESLMQIDKKSVEGMTFAKARAVSSDRTDFNFGNDPGRSQLMHTNYGSDGYRDLKRISKAASEGDPDANAYIESSGKGRSKALNNLVIKGILSSKYHDAENAKDLSTYAGVLGTSSLKLAGSGKSPEDILKFSLNRVLSGGTTDQQLEYMNVMSRISDSVNTTEGPSKDDLSAVNRLLGRDVDYGELRGLSTNAVKNINDAGYGSISHLKQFFGSAHNITDLSKGLEGANLPLTTGAVRGEDIEAMKAQSKVQEGMSKERARIYELSRNGKINGDTAMNAINSLDNEVAVGAFAEAVKQFGSYTKTLNGKAEDYKQGPNTVMNNQRINAKAGRYG